MARLSRLAVAGHSHLVLQRAHSARLAFNDAIDRQQMLQALQLAASKHGVKVQGYALLPHEAWLMLEPDDPVALTRMMQALGRRYVAAYNRRHGGHGTLWDGRYRCAVLEPGATRLQAMVFLDSAGDDGLRSSALHRSAQSAQPWLHQPPEFWALGNTPFEREAGYRDLLAQGVPDAMAKNLRQAASGSWAAGSAEFAARLAVLTGRPALARKRGRPRLHKTGANPD